jgi:hypothetical protein
MSVRRGRAEVVGTGQSWASAQASRPDLLPDHEAIASLSAGKVFSVVWTAASFARKSLSALWTVRTATDFRLNLMSFVCPSQTTQPFPKWMIVYIALIPKI